MTPFGPPRRIRASRAARFRLQDYSRALNGRDAVQCTRPGILGNPFTITTKVAPGSGGHRCIAVPTAADAVAAYREMMTMEGETADAVRARLPSLRGKNLACFCDLDQPCHADVLLELANKEEK